MICFDDDFQAFTFAWSYAESRRVEQALVQCPTRRGYLYRHIIT